MNEKTRATHIVNTVRVYREHADALRAIIPAVEAMDGKMLNKKLDDAMNAATLPAGLKYHFAWGSGHSRFKIEAYNCNRSYKETPDTPDGYACTGYIDNERTYLSIDFDQATTPTESGKSRINAAAIVEALEEEAQHNEKRAAALEETDGAQMLKDAQAISDALRVYREKYDTRSRELYGLDIRIERNSGKYNNYELRTV